MTLLTSRPPVETAYSKVLLWHVAAIEGSQLPGYSGTPLSKKVGIKPGYRIRTKNAPEDYAERLSPIPADVQLSASIRRRIALWYFFSTSEIELSRWLQAAKRQIVQNGMIRVLWPKKSSGVPSEITEESIRSVALPLGLIDVKCVLSMKRGQA